MKKFIAAGVVTYIMVLVALLSLPSAPKAESLPPSKVQAPVVPPTNKPFGIVRLHNSVTGDFVCSGFVVDKKTLFTAAHCIPEDLMLEVRSGNNKRTGIIATWVGSSPRADLAIMRGRLRSFIPVKYSSEPKTILNNIESNTRKISACGFPYGGKLLCVPVRNRRMYAFHIAGAGYLYPGMSGGPVFDDATQTVIALNSAVTADVILIAPLIEIYNACHVKP